MSMELAPHLQYLAEVVWAPGGPLQASLAAALGQPAPPVKLKSRAPQEPARDTIATALRDLHDAIQRGIEKVDEVMGDPDLEPEPDEADADFEPSGLEAAREPHHTAEDTNRLGADGIAPMVLVIRDQHEHGRVRARYLLEPLNDGGIAVPYGEDAGLGRIQVGMVNQDPIT